MGRVRIPLLTKRKRPNSNMVTDCCISFMVLNMLCINLIIIIIRIQKIPGSLLCPWLTERRFRYKLTGLNSAPIYPSFRCCSSSLIPSFDLLQAQLKQTHITVGASIIILRGYNTSAAQRNFCITQLIRYYCLTFVPKATCLQESVLYPNLGDWLFWQETVLATAPYYF